MEVNTNAWAYFDFRIDQAETNQTHFATKEPAVNAYVSVVTSSTLPQFPLIVNVPFNITFRIVDDTHIEIKRQNFNRH
jgi:hypothetical protein